MAILVAVVSWPFSVPTMRSRMVVSYSSVRARHVPYRDRASGAFRLDDFRHGYAKLVFHQHYLAARHQPVVDIDVDGFADATIEFEHGTGPELQQFADIHLGAAKHGRNLHRHVEHGFQIGRDARSLLVLVIGDVIDHRRVGGVEIGKRNLSVGVTHGSFLMVVVPSDRGTLYSVRQVRRSWLRSPRAPALRRRRPTRFCSRRSRFPAPPGSQGGPGSRFVSPTARSAR